jgi:methanogenic corrinoid protein MtbC1
VTDSTAGPDGDRDVVPRAWVDRFLDLVDQDRADEAADMVQQLTRSGWTVTEVVQQLLAPAKFEVGQRWSDGRYSVAQEHVATGVVDDTLGLLGAHTRPVEVAHTVAFACAEGEWHTTPARMAMLLMRDTGWRVRFLGGSLPPEMLGVSLAKAPPEALAISCTMAGNLPGVLPMIRVAHEHGVPVLVGGRAFDQHGQRAQRLGADAYVEFAWDAEPVLQRWATSPPSKLAEPRIDPAREAAQRRLAARASRVVDELHGRLAAFTPSNVDPAALPGRDDVDAGLRELQAAVLLDDPALFDNFVAWLSDLLDRRGAPGVALVGALLMLEELLGDDPPEATAVVEQVRTDLQRRIGT